MTDLTRQIVHHVNTTKLVTSYSINIVHFVLASNRLTRWNLTHDKIYIYVWEHWLQINMTNVYSHVNMDKILHHRVETADR